MKNPTPSRALLCAVLPLVLLCAAGCVTDKPKPPKPRPESVPWPQEGAPESLANLMADLNRFQDAVGRLPANLEELNHSRLTSGHTYAEADFTYHPRGIGILREGWRLVALSSVEKDGRVWGIASPPARVTTEPRRHTVAIPVIELREAADRMDSRKKM